MDFTKEELLTIYVAMAEQENYATEIGLTMSVEYRRIVEKIKEELTK